MLLRSADLCRRASTFAHTKRMTTPNMRMLHNSVRNVYPDFSKRNQIAVEPTSVPADKYLSFHRAESAAEKPDDQEMTC
jgi:hypothetical protein